MDCVVGGGLGKGYPLIRIVFAVGVLYQQAWSTHTPFLNPPPEEPGLGREQAIRIPQLCIMTLMGPSHHNNKYLFKNYKPQSWPVLLSG